MHVIKQHRGHPYWRMMLVSLVLLSGLVRHCEPMSVKRLTDASSSSSATLSRTSAESKSQNLGSPSDLAWQAWLLLDSQTGGHSGLDSASFLRRITPKSVFIAPALPALPPCADGYRADTMGRCVKNVNIDHEAHLGFLLQRLNNKYGNRGGNAEALSSNNNQKKSTGPFQLNIPLLSNRDLESSQVDHEETRHSIKIPIVVPAREEVTTRVEKRPLNPVVGIQETKNHSKPGEQRIDLFPGSLNFFSSGKDNQSATSKVDTAVPVAEFVDDVNDTNFSGVVDYKIPIDLKTILNISNMQTINATDDRDILNSTEVSPMLILLTSAVASSTSKSPIMDDIEIRNSTYHHAIVRVKNLTRDVADKEIIGTDIPKTVFPSRDLDIPPVVVEKIEPTDETRDGNSSEVRSTGAPESLEIESFYDEGDEPEDYIETTDTTDEESSEGGEILKHGEAGMAIPVKSIDRSEVEKHEQETEAENNETTKIVPTNEIVIRFNDTAKIAKEEEDETVSNVSSEVSINGDMILETTLLDVTTAKTRNNTNIPETNRTGTGEDSDDEMRELFESEKDSSTEIGVTLSPQSNYEKIPMEEEEAEDGNGKTESLLDPKSEELEAASSSSESLLYDPGTVRDQYTDEDPITEIHTIDEQTANSKEAFFPKKSKGSNFFRTYEPETMNFRPTLDYNNNNNHNRHPTYPRQPMRFPSEEVNSIHRQSYKGGVPYPLDDGLHSSTKSSVFAHQKPFHRGISFWRPFSRHSTIGQQQAETTATSNNQRHKLTPLSVSFWTTMPLMRDPSLYGTDQDFFHGKSTVNRQRSFASNRFPLVLPS